MLCTTRKEAKVKGDIHYFTGKPCKHGHVDNRLTSSSTCVTCNNNNFLKFKRKNPERVREIKRNYNKDNHQKVLEYNRELRKNNAEYYREYYRNYSIENMESLRESSKIYRENNKEQIARGKKEYNCNNRDIANVANRKWQRNNKSKVLASVNLRRARIKSAVPVWYDHQEVQQIYEECRNLTISTGLPHHVDHIVPLTNDLVCGLHCKDNLRIIPAKDNLSKGNTFVS